MWGQSQVLIITACPPPVPFFRRVRARVCAVPGTHTAVCGAPRGMPVGVGCYQNDSRAACRRPSPRASSKDLTSAFLFCCTAPEGTQFPSPRGQRSKQGARAAASAMLRRSDDDAAAGDPSSSDDASAHQRPKRRRSAKVPFGDDPSAQLGAGQRQFLQTPSRRGRDAQQECPAGSVRGRASPAAAADQRDPRGGQAAARPWVSATPARAVPEACGSDHEVAPGAVFVVCVYWRPRESA